VLSKSKPHTPPPKRQRPSWALPAVVIAVVGTLLALLSILTGVFRPAYVPEFAGGPHAEVDQLVIDHGDQRFNQFVQTVFRVRNVGDQELMIFRAPRVELIEGC
jgi:hypothetical protein